MTLRRTLVAALAATALVAPAAQAQPADIHAPLAVAAAKARASQDLRSPDARDAAMTVHRSGRPVELPPAGQPTWPVHPTALVVPSRPPVDDGSPVPVIPIAAAVLLVLAAGLTARYGTRVMHRRARIA